MAYFVLRPNTLGQLSVNSFLTAEECRSIIDEGERDLHLNQGTTGDQRTDLRKSDIAWLSPDGIHQWLFERVKDCVNDINRNWFGFNLLAFEGIQFTRYSQNRDAMGDHYGAHKDTKALPGGVIRKLSFTIQLCDGQSYDGGDVVLYDSFTDSSALSRSLGSISFFPSYTIHEVTPVTKGTRYSLVGWACGPTFV